MQGGQGWKWRSKSRRQAFFLSLLLHLLAFYGFLLVPLTPRPVPMEGYTVVLSPGVPRAEVREASRPPQPPPVRARPEPSRLPSQPAPRPTVQAEGSAQPAPSLPTAREATGQASRSGMVGTVLKETNAPPSQPKGFLSRKPGESGGETLAPGPPQGGAREGTEPSKEGVTPAPDAGGFQGPQEGFAASTWVSSSQSEGLSPRKPTEPSREGLVPVQEGKPRAEQEGTPGPLGIGGGQGGNQGEALGRGWASPRGAGSREEGGPVLGPGVGSSSGGGQVQKTPMGLGEGAGKEETAGTSVQLGKAASREGLGPSSGPGAGRESGRCAVVVELHGLPYAAGPSPAILDPEGRQVWPEPGRVQGVPSEVVDRSGIALFFRPGEFREEGFSRVYRVRALSTRARGPQNRFPELVVVSREEAEKVRLAPSTCQLVFIR